MLSNNVFTGIDFGPLKTNALAVYTVPCIVAGFRSCGCHSFVERHVWRGKIGISLIS